MTPARGLTDLAAELSDPSHSVHESTAHPFPISPLHTSQHLKATPKPSLITLLALTLLFANPAASLARWPITSMSDINKPAEKAMIDWIKKFTVPNTKRGDGSRFVRSRLASARHDRLITPIESSWTLSNLPSWVNANYASRGIKPNAWAAAIVTSWSLSEGIFNVGDFYRYVSLLPLSIVGLINDSLCIFELMIGLVKVRQCPG